MSLSIGRAFLSGPSIPVGSNSSRLLRISEGSLGSLSQRGHLTILACPLTALLKTSLRNTSRAVSTYASLAKSGGQRTSWDEAADSYFSEEGDKETPTPNPAGVKKWKSPGNGERQDFGDRERRDFGNRERQDVGNRERRDFGNRERQNFGNRERRDFGIRERQDFGSRERQDSGNREGQEFGSKSDLHEVDGRRREIPRRNSPSVDKRRDFRDVERASGYGDERNRTNQWQRPASASGYRSRESGAYNGRSGTDWQTRGKNAGSSLGKENNRGQDESIGFGDEWRWQAREYSPPLPVEGQPLYGVAPIISALQVSRRTFYCLYMQENLLLNIGNGKRKDKAAVSAIEKMARGMGVTVKDASKHDLNMLVDNRPHQGLILDASPLELIPVDALDAPAYQNGKPPVWVALDEVTDPQNFGAILRSAYFLGAEGVVVCAKNSAPLSGVVSKASAGAMEVMEVLFCKNMVRFLDRCKENEWRVVGASAEPSSVPIRQLPQGVATILVLGSEGKGLRTNVKRACDHLVSIAGGSNIHQRPKYDFVAQDFEDEESDLEEYEDGGRRGTESGLISGPSAVDSLNVSVAAGIMLYELLDSPIEKDVST